MNAYEVIEFARDIVDRATGVKIDEDEIPMYAVSLLDGAPDISSDLVNEIIMRCAIDPSISVAPGHDRFGEPSIILSESKEWIVELLSWNKMVTAIHEHSNAGAFRTLDGLRLQIAFEFEEHPSALVDDTVKCGELRCVKSEILTPRTTTPVYKRRNFIHGVWPIEDQATTLVFRRRGPNDSWSYLPSKITYNSRFAEKYLEARIRYLLDLSKYSMDLYFKAVTEICKAAPLAACVHLIPALGISLGDTLFDILIETCKERDVIFSDALVNVAENDQLFRSIFQLRRSVCSADQHKALAFMFYSKIIDAQASSYLSKILGLSTHIAA